MPRSPDCLSPAKTTQFFWASSCSISWPCSDGVLPCPLVLERFNVSTMKVGTLPSRYETNSPPPSSATYPYSVYQIYNYTFILIVQAIFSYTVSDPETQLFLSGAVALLKVAIIVSALFAPKFVDIYNHYDSTVSASGSSSNKSKRSEEKSGQSASRSKTQSQ